MRHGPIVAVGLLTQREVNLLGPTFDRLWPVHEAPCFNGVAWAIDKPIARSADRRSGRRARADAAGLPVPFESAGQLLVALRQLQMSFARRCRNRPPSRRRSPPAPWFGDIRRRLAFCANPMVDHNALGATGEPSIA